MIVLELSQGKTALIDDEDAHLARLKWCYENGYAARHVRNAEGRNSTSKLHRAIVGPILTGMMVDHINGDGLDNRRANLRIVSHAVNRRNVSGPQSNNKTSPYLGVSTKKKRNGFKAQICHNKNVIVLGFFPTAEEANEARIKAEARLWGIEPRRAALIRQQLANMGDDD